MLGVVFRVIESRTTFSPPIWATIGLISACGLFTWAGFWQLDRGAQKHELLAAFDASLNTELQTELVTDGSAIESRYRRIEISGEYDAQHQILLDSMLHKGRPGYYVLTPLHTPKNIILVNRGWVPADPDRSVLPELSVAEDERRVTGRLDLLPRPGVKLAPPVPTANAPWPRRLLFPSVQEISEQLGAQAYALQLLLDADNANGFVRDWRPAIIGPEKHLGYAIQWFGLAITLVIIYIVVNRKKTTRD